MTIGGRVIVAISLACAMLLTNHFQPMPRSRAATPGIAVALGDSIAAGIGASLPREHGNAAIMAGWLARLAGETVPSENLAVPGETATTFIEGGQLQRFRDTISRSQASGNPIAVVTLSLGGNELLALNAGGLTDRQAGLDEFRARYDEALGAIREELDSATPLVVMTIYDLSEGDPSIQYSDSWWIEQFNEVIRGSAQAHDALVADVAARFIGQISEYTHAPYDVHPTNAGHLAIAQTIWATLAIDDAPPTIAAEAEINTSRRTPTVQFEVADNLAVSSVTVASDDVDVRGPFETEDNHYAVLVDLQSSQREEVALTIEIGDDAGNTTRQVIMVKRAVAGQSEGQ